MARTGILGSTGVISGSKSHLPAVASQYLLPACLTLLTLGTNVSAIARLGKKAVSMFAIGALGVMVGGPLAILIVKIFHKPVKP